MAGDCQICLDGIADDPAAVSCGHIYHKTCIQHWLKKSKTCPTCRAEARNAISLRWSFAPALAVAGSSSAQTQESADVRELRRKNQGLKQRIQSLTTELEAAEKQQQRSEDLRKQLDASKQREAKAARDLVLERKKAKLAEMESEQLIKALQDRIQQLEESTRQDRTADMAAAYARRFLFAGNDDSPAGAAQEHLASITFANTVREKSCDPYQIIQMQHDMIAKLNAKVRASIPLQPRPASRVPTKAEEEESAHARRKAHSASAPSPTQTENIKPQAPSQRADEIDGASRPVVASGALSKIASFSTKRTFNKASSLSNAGLSDPHKRARQL